MKKFLMLILVLSAAFILAACKRKTETPEDLGRGTQGVTDTKILVGNTAATSGGYAAIGVPFNDALKAVFEKVNNAGGIGGRTIDFVTYDDGFDAAQGLTLTRKLLDEDKVFALVGHFGTPTVGATIDILKDEKVPMVYAATGINALYFKEAKGSPILAVQPIYLTDGRLMTARAIKEKVYGVNGDQAINGSAKIGVLYTNDDVGNSIKAGVAEEAKALNKEANMIYETVTAETVSTAVNKLKQNDVATVILAVNQIPFAYCLTALHNASLNVPVFTSYVNADVTAVNHEQINAARPIYTNAWVDVFSTKGQADVGEFIATINASSLSAEKKAAYATNSFAIAGYIAGMVFVEGLKRVDAAKEALTVESYIAAMEKAAINIPMGGTVDFSGGKRWGIDSMSLLKYQVTIGQDDKPVEAFVKVREIETLTQIEGKK